MDILDGKTVSWLKRFCRDNGLKGYSKYNKEKLKEFIRRQAMTRGIDLTEVATVSDILLNPPPPAPIISATPIVIPFAQLSYSDKYIEPAVFFARFGKMGTEIGCGVYGSITESLDPDFIVKSIKSCDPSAPIDDSFIREINYYSMFDHPCIMRLEAWTFEDTTGYLVLPRGKNIEEAVMNGDITVEEVMADMISAVSYLHSLKVAHLDIKIDNTLFHNGHAKLIDFGLANNATLFASNKRLYVYSVGFTPDYRWPEYLVGRWNPIEADFYAVAKTVFGIATVARFRERIKRLYTFRTGNLAIDHFISQVAVLRDQLKTSAEIVANTPVVRTSTGVVLETPVFDIDPACGVIQAHVFKWLLDISKNLRAKTIFLAIHLFHRTLRIVISDYVSNDAMVQLVAMACLYLAIITTHDRNYNFNDWIRLSNGHYTEDEFKTMIVQVMVAARGIIQTPTYWDAAKSEDDLAILLNDTLNCNYTGQKMRKLTGTTGDKDIMGDKLVSLYEFYYSRDKTQEEMWEPIPVVVEVKDYGVSGKPSQRPDMRSLMRGISMLYNSYRIRDYSYLDAYNNIMYNRSLFSYLDVTDARNLYDLLKKYIDKGAWDILQMTVDFNFEVVDIRDISSNPFLTSCSEIPTVPGACPPLPVTYYIP